MLATNDFEKPFPAEKEMAANSEKQHKASLHEHGLDPTQAGVDAFLVDENDPTRINYKNMGWVKAGALIMAETIALGILSFPSVFHRIGMAPGIIVTVVLALVSWYTGYVIVQFKVNHPGVMNFGDAGNVIGGKWGGWILGGMLITKVTFVAGSHSLSGAIALSNISSNAICSIAYAVIIAFVSFLLTIPRTFEKVSYISFVSVTSILIAVLITIIASGVQSIDTLQEATGKNLGPVEWHASEHHSLVDTIGAITNIIFAYGGHVAIFSFASEMREPRDFKYSLALVQTVATVFYIVTGATIYSFSGQYVTSPALTAVGDAVRITAYAIALVSIIVAGVVASYVGSKFVFMTIFRGTTTLTSSGKGAWAAWITVCAVLWTVGFIIAEVVPFFNQLLSIISSLMTVWFTYGLSGFLWFYDNHPQRAGQMTLVSGTGGYFSTPWKGFLAVCNVAIILISAGIMGLGTYGAVQGIIDGYHGGQFSHPFSCGA